MYMVYMGENACIVTYCKTVYVLYKVTGKSQQGSSNTENKRKITLYIVMLFDMSDSCNFNRHNIKLYIDLNFIKHLQFYRKKLYENCLT